VTATFREDLSDLLTACAELRSRLQEVRLNTEDEEFDTACDGTFGELICAAMDIEYSLEKIEHGDREQLTTGPAHDHFLVRPFGISVGFDLHSFQF